MGKPTNYCVLVYQEQHFSLVPKAALKKVLSAILRSAQMPFGVYYLKITSTITPAPQSMMYFQTYFSGSKKDQACNRLKIRIQLSSQTNDTYLGTLDLPRTAVAANLADKLNAAAKTQAEVLSETIMPTPEVLSVRTVSSPVLAVVEFKQPLISTDSILQDLTELETSFRKHLETLRSLLLLPRRIRPRSAKLIRKEFSIISFHFRDLSRLKNLRLRMLSKNGS